MNMKTLSHHDVGRMCLKHWNYNPYTDEKTRKELPRFVIPIDRIGFLDCFEIDGQTGSSVIACFVDNGYDFKRLFLIPVMPSEIAEKILEDIEDSLWPL